ncbi:MAG: hypothetical protein K6F83_07290 [Clostridiales bacterium]|nr:hypothetical protein [Clostridiales bacterium]
MNKAKKFNQFNQMIAGLSKMCAETEDCHKCSFYIERCVFGEPMPRTWTEEKAEEEGKPDSGEPSAVAEEVAAIIEEPAKEETSAEDQEDKGTTEDDDSEGTWIVNTTMGSVLSKYVFICSKCGYKKESYFSIPPVSFCPECEKRKGQKS